VPQDALAFPVVATDFDALFNSAEDEEGLEVRAGRNDVGLLEEATLAAVYHGKQHRLLLRDRSYFSSYVDKQSNRYGFFPT
jgi:hypothetical protein